MDWQIVGASAVFALLLVASTAELLAPLRLPAAEQTPGGRTPADGPRATRLAATAPPTNRVRRLGPGWLPLPVLPERGLPGRGRRWGAHERQQRRGNNPGDLGHPDGHLDGRACD